MLPEPKIPPKVLPLGGNVDPPRKIFPNLVPGMKSPGPDMDTKGKPPHDEKFPPRDVPPGKGVLTHGKGKPLEVPMLPGLLRIAPKPLGILHPKGTPGPDDVGPLIGLVEVEGAPLPMLKPNLSPPLENNSKVGIDIEGTGVGMIGILKNGYDDTNNVP